MVDSRGVLWAGGDIARSETVGGRTQWSDGFVRFAPRDVSAPVAPTGLRVVPDTAGGSATHTLSWSGSTEPGTVYHVMRGDRTVATTAASASTPLTPAAPVSATTASPSPPVAQPVDAP